MLYKNLFFLGLTFGLLDKVWAEDGTVQPELVVTASRVSETVDASLASVSIITRSDIEHSSAHDVIDLLRLQPGVDIARTGGAGETTSIFLRGTNSNHVLVLIDGVRVASANTGSYTFEQLPMDAIERIEIVRGPRASYWGSDAIGGVIQIFTRSLTGPLLAASYGSYRSAIGSAGYGVSSDVGNFSLQLGARHVGGFSAENPAGFSYNPDADSYQNHNLLARGAIHIGEQTLSANVLRSQGSVDFDQGRTHMLDQSAGVELQGALTEHWQQRLSLGAARENLDTPDFFSLFLTRRESLSWQNNVEFSTKQHMTAGVEYIHEHGENQDTSSGAALYAASRDNSALYGGWRSAFSNWDTEISARYDHNDRFGNAVSGSAALGWQFNDAGRLLLSYGTGFRSPSLNEQYSPGYGGLFAGNPDLDPEQSRSVEIGLDYRFAAAQRFNARIFSTRIHDLITFTGGSTFRAENIDRAAIDGLELQHNWQSALWSLTQSVTWQNPRNQESGSALLRRPKFKFSNVLERQIGERGQMGAELTWTGKREDFGTRLPAYSLINLRANYALCKDWRFGARLENLFDRDYELVHGFNTAGRSVYAELIWQPH